MESNLSLLLAEFSQEILQNEPFFTPMVRPHSPLMALTLLSNHAFQNLNHCFNPVPIQTSYKAPFLPIITFSSATTPFLTSFPSLIFSPNPSPNLSHHVFF